jgi:UDP-glucose 4-epimerase
MPILLTGSTGFLGSRVGEALIGRGEAVRALVRTPPQHDGGLAIVRGDLRDASAVEEAVRGAEIVCHLGLIYGPSQRFDHREFEVNTRTTEMLLRAAAKARARKFVFASSVMVYGWLHPPESWPLRESAPLSANFPYGLAKIRSEEAVRAICRANGLNYAILRLSPIYGPGVPRYERFFRRLLTTPLLWSDPFRVVGPGLEHVGVSHWIHVRDAADAVLRAILKPGVCGTFNIAGPRAAPRSELIALAHGRPLRNAPALTIYGTQLARQELGFAPSTTIRSGVEEVLASMSAAPYQPVRFAPGAPV